MFGDITSIAVNLAKGKLNLCQKDGHKKAKTITKKTTTMALKAGNRSQLTNNNDNSKTNYERKP